MDNAPFDLKRSLSAAPFADSRAGVAARALGAAVRGYQLLLSPWIGSQCRFTPRCSDYALQALAEHGALQGAALSAKRIARCNPWCDGGHDPVPPSRRTL